MYRNLDDFLSAYTHESQTTQRVLEALTDETLGHEKAPGDTPIGELAWHIATAPAMMLAHEGAGCEASWTPPAGLTKQQIVDEFKRVNAACIEGCKAKLADADLTRSAKWFGYELPLGVWLNMVPNHEVHHRGQLSAMMRNAGLQVPSIYGPNKEEFEEMMKSGKFGNPEAAAQG